MAKFSEKLVKFANNNTTLLNGMRDYYFHYMDAYHGKKLGDYSTELTYEEKDEKMNKALLREIERVSGTKLDGEIGLAQLSVNPVFRWAAFAVADMMIEAVLPDTIDKSIGIYTDIRHLDFGDSALFEVKPNALFTVSQGANAQRTMFRQKQFARDVTLVPINHAVTVQVSLYRVLAGKESLAEFVRKAVLGMETEMTRDAYNAFHTGITNADIPAPLNVGGYTQDSLITMCQTVTAYNHGSKAVIVGTTKALSKVLPDSAAGYRIVTPSEAMGIQIIRNFFDYDIIELPQIANNDYVNYSLALDDDRIYVVSPSSDKLVKGAIEGVALTNSNDFYENANLTSNATLNKRWDFEYVSNAIAGTIKLSGN